MADTEADQLTTLLRERERLEGILMGDANWRALCALDRRSPHEQSSQASTTDPERDEILRLLETNTAYAARRDILSRIALLSPGSQHHPQSAPPPADRTADDWQQSSQFRTRIKVKPKPPRLSEHETENQAAAGDDLTRINGIDAERACSLRDLGVSTFAEIAAWTDEEVKIVDELLACPQGDECARSWRTSAASLAVAGNSKLVTEQQPGRDPTSTVLPPASQAPPEDIAPAAVVDSFFTSTPDAGIAIIPPEARASQPETKPRQASPPTTRRRPASSLIELLALAANSPDESTTAWPAGAPQSQRFPQATRTKTDPDSLLRRLQTVKPDEHPPSPGNYAAYRGIAEEASVTIVLPEGEDADDATPEQTRDASPRHAVDQSAKLATDTDKD